MAMTLIADNTADTTDLSDYSITSGIDSTYKLYIFKVLNVNPANDGTFFQFQVNASGQSGYNESLQSCFFSAQLAEADSDGALSYHTSYDQANGTSFQYLQRMVGNDADQSLSGTLWLFNPSSTTFAKHFYSVFNGVYHADYSMNTFVSGYANVTAAITDIQFKMSAGNFDVTIKMYGVG